MISSEKRQAVLQSFEDGGDCAAGMAQIPAQLAKIPAPNQSESKLQICLFFWRLSLGVSNHMMVILGFGGGLKFFDISNGSILVFLGFTSQSCR